MSKFFKYLLLVVISSFVLSHSSLAEIGDYTFRRGLGARAAGMGGAYTAIADDASAVFYNPAGLALPGFCYSYGSMDSAQRSVRSSLELLKMGFLGYAGWSVTENTGDQSNTSAIAFGNRRNWLHWGFNYKSSAWSTGGVTLSGWSTDIGLLANITPDFKIGLVAQDLLTSNNSLSPYTTRLGLAFKPFDGKLTIAGDWAVSRSTNYAHFGIETAIMKGFSTRVGVDRGELTLGTSLDFAFMSFDYAALLHQNNQTTHRFESGFKVLPHRKRPFSIFKDKEYALIEISGAIQGGRTEYSFLGGVKSGLDSILRQIRRAGKDQAIDGIMLKIRGFSGGLGGMAIVQEIRGELERVRQKGKKIVAYCEHGAIGDEYYLASIADKIITPPGAAIGGFGRSINTMQLKGLYDMIGVNMYIFTQGDYKDAFGTYQNKLSKKQRQRLKALVADLYRQMITDIAKDRKIKLTKMKEIGDGMIFTAKEAKALGLVDQIGYYKDSRLVAGELSGKKDKAAKVIEPRYIETDEVFLTGVFGVGVIEIDGEIVSGSGGENVIFGGRYVGSDTIADYLRQAADDVFIKAIILRINSPGGGAIAAGEIYRAIQYVKSKKKIIIASIGSLGTSGGYYLACGADKIIADPSSITGSIGIVGQIPVYAKLLKKLKINTEVIKEGEHADMFSGLRELTTVEVAAIKRLQKASYDEFIDLVVAARKLPTAEVLDAAQGKLYTGTQALELKLIDSLGGFAEAVDLAKAEAKMLGEPRLIFYHQPSVFFKFGAGLTESMGLSELWPLWKLVPQVAEYN